MNLVKVFLLKDPFELSPPAFSGGGPAPKWMHPKNL